MMLILSLFLLIFSNSIVVRILLKTEINTQLRIDPLSITTFDRQIPFSEIALLKLIPHISYSRSWYIPRWKRCYKLELKLNDASEFDFLISEQYPPLTVPIIDLLEDIKKSNKQYAKKILLPNRTGFFKTKNASYST